jgi:GDP-D-mannose dehydratase
VQKGEQEGLPYLFQGYENKLKAKLLNASSSEIFKGHHNYTVTSSSNHFMPTHPYSFAKLLGHQFIDFYRSTYNLPFYNCIVFTTESSLRNNFFLFKVGKCHCEGNLKKTR